MRDALCVHRLNDQAQRTRATEGTPTEHGSSGIRKAPGRLESTDFQNPCCCRVRSVAASLKSESGNQNLVCFSFCAAMFLRFLTRCNSAIW